MTKQIPSAIKVSLLALLLSFGLSFAYAWTAPTQNPPAGNVSAPINTSATAQTKAGGLTVDSATSTKDIMVNGITAGKGAGVLNTVFGDTAFPVNVSGQQNTAIGFETLKSNISGDSNTAVGLRALYFNTSGWQNTASGIGALMDNTLGDYNTATGYYSLLSNTIGSYNTAIGERSDVSSGALTNATAIGANALVSASDEMQLGDTNVKAVRTSGKIYAGTGKDVCITGGKCLSTVGTPTGSLINMYQCPGPVSLGGGAWGYYGCQNQIQNQPTCYEVEYPTTQTFNCGYVGKMRLEP